MSSLPEDSFVLRFLNLVAVPLQLGEVPPVNYPFPSSYQLTQSMSLELLRYQGQPTRSGAPAWLRYGLELVIV